MEQRTGANEARNRRGLSQMKKRKAQKNRRIREYRAIVRGALRRLRAFRRQPRIAENYRVFEERSEQVRLSDVTPDSSYRPLDFNLPDVNGFSSDEWWVECYPDEGNLAGSSNVALGSMNSTATGGVEPHHDPLGMQGETSAAAGSSSVPTTKSSPQNEKF